MTGHIVDRIAVVFGGGCQDPGWGNGKAASVAYAREGAEVVVVDKSWAAAEETARLIGEEGGRAFPILADVTDGADVARAVAAVIARHGRIDIVHNNVGEAVMGDAVELDETLWQHAVDVNIGSVWRVCHHVLPHLVARRSGVIINISSIGAIRWAGYPYFAYAATKAAVNQATQALALQYAPLGIRANCIMPGLIDTPLIYRQISGHYADVQAMREARNRMVPLGHMGSAWDVANAAIFLASDDARFITGVCLPVDGGSSCSMVAPA